jgi:sulfite reductase beta subunit-like hemoprotein
MFRKKLLDLIPTLRKVKAGPLEAEFEMAAKQVLAGTADLKSEAGATEAPRVSSGSSVEDVAAKLLTARSEPTATIIEGWSTLDGELHKLGRQTGLVVDPLESQEKVYKAIMASNELPSGTKQLVRDLRQLRNQVAHAKVVPTPDSAQAYLVAVERVVELVRNYRKNLPGYTPDVR